MRHTRELAEPTLGTSRLVAGMLLVAVIAPACVAIYVGMGSPVAMPPTIAFLIAALVWLRRLRHEPVRHRQAGHRAFSTFIATLVALIIQYTEQWLAHLPAEVMRLFPGAFPAGVAYTEHAMIAVFPLASSSMFLFGALALYHRHAAGEGAAWLLFLWSIVSGFTPFAYAMLGHSGMHYVGGMLASPLVVACGAAGLYRLGTSPPLALHAAERGMQ